MGGRVIGYAIVGLILLGVALYFVYQWASKEQTRKRDVDQTSEWRVFTEPGKNDRLTDVGIVRVQGLYQVEKRVLATLANEPYETYSARLAEAQDIAYDAKVTAQRGLEHR